MPRRNNDWKPWRITVRDLIVMMTGVCMSLSLFLASKTIPVDELYLVIVSNLLSLYMLGGSLGVVGWRLWCGTQARTFDAFCGGGCLLLVFLWIISPFVIVLIHGF